MGKDPALSLSRPYFPTHVQSTLLLKHVEPSTDSHSLFTTKPGSSFVLSLYIYTRPTRRCACCCWLWLWL